MATVKNTKPKAEDKIYYLLASEDDYFQGPYTKAGAIKEAKVWGSQAILAKAEAVIVRTKISSKNLPTIEV